MHKKYLIYITAVLFLISCAGTGGSSRLGTGKPKFASLELEGVSYFLSSENGSFDQGKPLKVRLVMKNTSQVKKTFMIEKNRLVILQIKNEYGENLRTEEVPASAFIQGSSFSIFPGEERQFDIMTDTKDAIFKNNDQLSCSIRLYFLPKMFRRNTLSIYLDRE